MSNFDTTQANLVRLGVFKDSEGSVLESEHGKHSRFKVRNLYKWLTEEELFLVRAVFQEGDEGLRKTSYSALQKAVKVDWTRVLGSSLFSWEKSAKSRSEYLTLTPTGYDVALAFFQYPDERKKDSELTNNIEQTEESAPATSKQSESNKLISKFNLDVLVLPTEESVSLLDSNLAVIQKKVAETAPKLSLIKKEQSQPKKEDLVLKQTQINHDLDSLKLVPLQSPANDQAEPVVLRKKKTVIVNTLKPTQSKEALMLLEANAEVCGSEYPKKLISTKEKDNNLFISLDLDEADDSVDVEDDLASGDSFEIGSISDFLSLVEGSSSKSGIDSDLLADDENQVLDQDESYDLQDDDSVDE